MKSLVQQILNGQRSAAFAHLSHESEINELGAIPAAKIASRARILRLARSYKGQVRLNRSFTQSGVRFWRVNCPGHKSHESDLSYEGLVYWGII